MPFDIFVKKYISNSKNELLNENERFLNEWLSFYLFSIIIIGDPIQNIYVYINPKSSCFQLNKFDLEELELNKFSHFFSDNENPINFPLFNLTESKTFKDVSDKYPGTYFASIGTDEIYI